MKKELAKIAKKYDIDLMILFGSAARGRTHPKSDIDIAVRRLNKLTLNQYGLLSHELQSVFGREIDIAEIKEGGPLILEQIARYGKLLYGSQKDFLNFKIYAQQKFIDFEPYFKLEKKILQRNIRELCQTKM